MFNSSRVPRSAAGMFVGWRKLASCVGALTAATAVFAGSQFSSIVAFGDSMSDTGRLYRLTDGGFPPRIAYHNGRQSNGPVWIEYLADSLGLDHQLINYAVVGALTAPSAADPSGNKWGATFTGLEGTSLRGQFDRYLADAGGKVDPEALYIVEGGANDLIGPFIALMMNPPATDAEFIQRVNEMGLPVVVNVATIVGTLKAMGAQHIAIVNLPDLGKSPRLIQYGPVASAIFSFVLESVNEAVADQLDAIDASGGNQIARIDAFSFLRTVAAAPASFGFTNVTDQYMTLDLLSGTVTYAGAKHRDVAQWLFWDDLHPTTRGHAILAQGALVTLRASFPGVHAVH